MADIYKKQESAKRLLQYSAAASLGAFAFGHNVAESAVVYTDLGGMVINRGEEVTFDIDGDGYNDFRLRNTLLGGIGGNGTVQLNTSIDPGWYGAPGTNASYPNAGATYLQINMDAPSTKGTNSYYLRSFIDNDIIGPSNPKTWDETGGAGGRLYGMVSQYPGWSQNSFWNPVFEPWASNGSIPYPGKSYTINDLPDNEYAGLRIVDGDGNERWAWVRFQVIVNDTGIQSTKFPGQDGYLTAIDFVYDTNRQVILYDMAIEMTPGTDILAGAVPEPGCLGLLAAGLGGLSLRRRSL